MKSCSKCTQKTLNIFTTAYSEHLCEDCWDDYLWTDFGKVEYFIGICHGDYPLSDFDADFLGHVVTQWYINKETLSLSKKEILQIETIAKNIGLI